MTFSGAVRLAVSCALSVFAAFPQSVADWLPLQPGTSWTYLVQHSAGNPDKPTIIEHRITLKITRHVQMKEGLLVIREATGARDDLSSSFDTGHWFIRGNQVFDLPTMFLGPNDVISGDFLNSVLSGDATPSLQFPLTMNSQWAERNRKRPADDFFYCWYVSGRGAQGRAVTMPVSSDAYILTYQALSGPVEVWFEKGKGIVAQWDYHAGTYWENNVRLIAHSAR